MSDLEDFFFNYCKLVNSDQLNFCITEKSINPRPLIIIFTLIFDQEEEDEDENIVLYDELYIFSVVKIIQEILIDNFNLSDDLNEVIACVLETMSMFDRVDDEDCILRQIKIQFPYCVLDMKDQKMVLNQMIRKINSQNVAVNLIRQPSHGLDRMLRLYDIDDEIALYGKNINSKYKDLSLKYVLPQITDDDINNGEISPFELENVFFPQNHSLVSTLKVISHEIIENDTKEFLLPLFLSTGYHKKPCLLKSNIKPETIKNNLQNDIQFDDNDIENELPIQRARRFISMLSESRVSNKMFRNHIGKALYNITKKGRDGLDLWKQLVNKYYPDMIHKCDQFYYTFGTNNPYSIKTLAWYARQDSPEAYNEWHEKWYQPSMDKSIMSLSSADNAEAMYRITWLEFICKMTKTETTLYEYKDHRLIADPKGSSWGKMFSKEYCKMYERLRTKISIKIEQSTDRAIMDHLEEYLKKINKLIHQIKDLTFEKKVYNKILQEYEDKKIVTFLDSNNELTGCNDCIIEICGGKAMIREGEIEDYISMSTRIDLDQGFSESHPAVINYRELLKKLFVDRELRVFFIKLCASMLRRGNNDKILMIWTGKRDGGKSGAKKLVEEAFGEYCINFPNTVLTKGKRSASGPNPEIARAKDKAVAFAQETGNNDSIQDNSVKELVGGDSFFARMCCENGGDIKATAKMVLICNKPPNFPNCDSSVTEKIMFLPFLSRFSSVCPETEEERIRTYTFPRDKYFDRKIPELAPVFLWDLCMNGYELYCNEGLEMPQIVRDHTKKFWNDNDAYKIFMTEFLETPIIEGSISDEFPDGKPDEKCTLNLSEFYMEFRNWWKDMYPHQPLPGRDVVKYILEEKLNTRSDNGIWAGIRLKKKKMDFL